MDVRRPSCAGTAPEWGVFVPDWVDWHRGLEKELGACSGVRTGHMWVDQKADWVWGGSGTCLADMGLRQELHGPSGTDPSSSIGRAGT